MDRTPKTLIPAIIERMSHVRDVRAMVKGVQVYNARKLLFESYRTLPTAMREKLRDKPLGEHDPRTAGAEGIAGAICAMLRFAYGGAQSEQLIDVVQVTGILFDDSPEWFVPHSACEGEYRGFVPMEGNSSE